MADGNPPRVLVINYDEEGNYASNHDDEKNNILSKIGKYESDDLPKEPWDFIFLCTQKSLSSTKDHMQYVINKIIGYDKKSNNNSIYELFSQLNATRKANTSFMRITKDSKFKNVSLTCWKLRTIFTPNKMVYLSKESYHCNPNSYVNDLNYFIQADDNDIDDVNPNVVNIIKYKYKRITNSEENSTVRKDGDGAIIICIGLKKNGVYYDYIICNYDSPKMKLGESNIPTNNSQKSIYRNSIESPFRPLGDSKGRGGIIHIYPLTPIQNLFISYLSRNSIIYKYINGKTLTNIHEQKAPIYNLLWNKTKRVTTNNSKIYGLTLEQIV